MPDREKVITALAICIGKCKCFGCWYGQNNPDFRCQDRLKEDALALLREQKQEPAIVRCKDCKHGADTIINGEYLFKTCGGVDHKPDWFCADGERR